MQAAQLIHQVSETVAAGGVQLLDPRMQRDVRRNKRGSPLRRAHLPLTPPLLRLIHLLLFLLLGLRSSLLAR